MEALQAKSLAMTAYMRSLLPTSPLAAGTVLTPSAPGTHGAQLSIAFEHDARTRHSELTRRGIICDFRAPNIIRLAPAPLYNSFMDIHTTLTA
jgi:kynureninase